MNVDGNEREAGEVSEDDVERRPEIERLFRATTPAGSEALRAEGRRVAGRLFGLGEDELGPAAPGSSVGPYRVLRLLGVGGQGFVYEAEHHQLERRVALKIPRRAVAERLLHEARLAARLEHPRVVRVESIHEHEGSDGVLPFLVMELCPGGSLHDLLERHPDGMPLDEVRRIARGVLEALSYAHTQGVVHRDVKPANVLFDAAGQVKLSDLGIGSLAADAATLAHSVEVSRERVAGALMGTPLYMAPEQLRPGQDIDGRADLFSFGKLLFVMLTGATPSTIRPPSRLRAGLSPEWDDLVFALLEEDPARRPADADAVRSALETIRDEPFRLLDDGRPAAEARRALRILPRADGDAQGASPPASPTGRLLRHEVERTPVPAAERRDPLRRDGDGPSALNIRISEAPRGGSVWVAALLVLLGGASSVFATYLVGLALSMPSVRTFRIGAGGARLLIGGTSLSREHFALAAAALLGTVLLMWLGRRAARTVAQPGPGVLLLALPLVVWQPVLHAGRVELNGAGMLRAVHFMRHDAFLDVVVLLCVASVAVALTLAKRALPRTGPPPSRGLGVARAVGRGTAFLLKVIGGLGLVVLVILGVCAAVLLIGIAFLILAIA